MKKRTRLSGILALVVSLGTAVTVAGYIHNSTRRSALLSAPRPTTPVKARPRIGQRVEEAQLDVATYNLLYVESDSGTSVIWSASPDSPISSRREVLTLSHTDGYPPKASLAPSGEYLAYILLTEGKSPAFSGSLWVISLKDRIPRQIDANVDYGWSPKWSNNGSSFIYVKKEKLGSETEYRNDVYVANPSGQLQLLLSDGGSLEVVPVGWNLDDKHVYVDRIEEAGDVLYDIEAESGRARVVSRLSHTAAWNLSLSPDGKRILGSILIAPGRAEYSVVSVSVETGEIQTIIGGASSHYTPIWNPKQEKITTSVPDGDSQRGSFVAEVDGQQKQARIKTSPAVIELPEQQSVSDKTIPLSWSPDGQWLALQTYHQSSADLTLVRSSDGRAEMASSQRWMEFIGWLKVR
jgi:hypothetical protein